MQKHKEIKWSYLLRVFIDHKLDELERNKLDTISIEDLEKRFPDGFFDEFDKLNEEEQIELYRKQRKADQNRAKYLFKLENQK